MGRLGKVVLAMVALAAIAARPPVPHFRAERDWLRLPHGWVLGEVSAVDVDAAGHVWLLQRPRTLAAADRAHAAPPVLEFLPDGRFVGGWGGDGPGYDWPATEHSLAVDRSGRVWISGSYRADASRADDAVLAFDARGHFLRQIGRRGGSGGDRDTAAVHAAADLFVDDRAHELYVADGYGNRRLIVFDTETGRFKRMWSGFGAPPSADPAPDPRAAGAPFTPEAGDGPAGFNGVHGVEIARDGLVYVSDRNNQRIQVFTRAGRFVRQGFVDRNARSPQTASGLAFSPERAQRLLYVADWGNAALWVLDRRTLATLARVDAPFTGPHLLAMGARGTLYVADVQGRALVRLVPR